MKKSTFIALAALLVFFAASVTVLRIYQLDLVQAVVENAVLQKSPDSEAERIRREFAHSRQKAEEKGGEALYLKKLFEISQRLERTQQIDMRQLDEILTLLGAGDASDTPPAPP